MERDKRGFLGDFEEPVRNIRSSSIDARSSSISRRINSDVSQQEIDQVIFDQPTRRRAPVIEEYERRNRRLPHTSDDHRIQRPRYPQQRQEARISKRKFFGLLGVSVAVIAGGVGVAVYDADQARIDQRMMLGQHSLILATVQRAGGKQLKIAAWISDGGTITVFQKTSDSKTDSVDVETAYAGQIDQVALSFSIQSKMIVINMTFDGKVLMIPFKDNGQFFVEGNS